ncbi:hypothetical protein [Zunongwangia sp.]|uniref:hypothetical protein n=1 Tax=Zunongwangia sp. TaxID=1965325 RepID=UPI003AA8D1D1
MKKIFKISLVLLLISCSDSDEEEIITLPPVNYSEAFIYDNFYEIKNLELEGNSDHNIEYSYKLDINKNQLSIFKKDKDVQIGKIVNENELVIFKNYLSYLVMIDKNNNEIRYGKSNDLGLIEKKDIFPRIINSYSDLNEDEEFILWSNIAYKFVRKI